MKIANALGISINALYSHDINTVSDVITLLMKLHEQTALNIAGDKNEAGDYIPESIRLSFDDDNINKALVQYLLYKETSKSVTKEYVEFDNEHQITNLIISDTIIKRPI